jgi:hypothetical protein
LEKLVLLSVFPGTNLYECIEVLRGAPLLRECEIGRIRGIGDAENAGPQRLTHPYLRYLRLGDPDGYSHAACILDHLTLPALEDLVIVDIDISDDDFIAFLTRSSPPLQSLYIAAQDQNMGETYLRLIPSLTDLTLECMKYNPALPVVETMTTNLDLLPNLRHLATLRYYSIEYDKLVIFLTVRRTSGCTQLQSFQFILPYNSAAHNPDENTITLRRFVEDGAYLRWNENGESCLRSVISLSHWDTI